MPRYTDHERRMELWRHNSLRGHARMMQMQLRAIIEAPTPTDEAKAEAFIALTHVERLIPKLTARRATALNKAKALETGD